MGVGSSAGWEPGIKLPLGCQASRKCLCLPSHLAGLIHRVLVLTLAGPRMTLMYLCVETYSREQTFSNALFRRSVILLKAFTLWRT